MSQNRLADHLDLIHDVQLCEGTPPPLDDWLEADRIWQITLEINPPDPLPCEWDSEKGQLISERESQAETDSDDEKPKMFQLPAQKSSSADSSSEESQNKPSRKNKNRRIGALKTDITAVKSEIEVVNENLGYIEGKIVAFEDGMENIREDVSQANKEMNLIKIEQRSCSESIKESFKNQSQILEEKVDSNSLHLRNEVNPLKSDLRNYSQKIGDLENTVSNLTTLITSLTTMLEKNGPTAYQE